MGMEEMEWLEEALTQLALEWAEEAQVDPRNVIDSDYNEEWCPEFGEDYHD
jgi:hypothetical protein